MLYFTDWVYTGCDRIKKADSYSVYMNPEIRPERSPILMLQRYASMSSASGQRARFVLFYVLILCLTLCLTFFSAAVCFASVDVQPEKRYLESMDTMITLTAYGENARSALDQAEQEIIRLDSLLSTGLADSEISRLNAVGSMILSEDSRSIVEKSLQLYRETGGLFDITVYPLMQLWGFAHKSTDLFSEVQQEPDGSPEAALSGPRYHVPSPEELADALSRVGSDRLDYDEKTGTLTLGEGQSVDLGGIAKGYTSQRLMDLFRDAGLTSAMVSLGGNVQCLGRKPDGTDYVIAIRNPFDPQADYSAVLKVHDAAVITSGGSERFFTDEETGRIYQHIMDPETGCPAESDLASVTIVTSDGMLGDGLSTALYIMGHEKAAAFWQENSSRFQLLLIGLDGKIYVSEGLAERMLTPEDFAVIPFIGS